MLTRMMSSLALAAVLFITSPAMAHVVVHPDQAGVAAFQTFTIGVPNEKEGNATVSLRLIIPEGLEHVSPNVKPGWTVQTKTNGEGEEALVTEIIWTGGEIPAGQRDDFVFSAQTPVTPTTLTWKAYQTYADGAVVSWDQDAGGKNEEGSTPASQTKVVDDLATVETPAKHDSLALGLSIAALALAALTWLRRLKDKQE